MRVSTDAITDAEQGGSVNPLFTEATRQRGTNENPYPYRV